MTTAQLHYCTHHGAPRGPVFSEQHLTRDNLQYLVQRERCWTRTSRVPLPATSHCGVRQLRNETNHGEERMPAVAHPDIEIELYRYTDTENEGDHAPTKGPTNDQKRDGNPPEVPSPPPPTRPHPTEPHPPAS